MRMPLRLARPARVGTVTSIVAAALCLMFQ
jgi:hypothetical protein